MLKFKTLWDNYPDLEEIKKRCFNKQNNSGMPFENYCSILMSECMIKSGIQLNRCNGSKCWSHSGSKHILRAEELANWLRTSAPSEFGQKEDISPSEFQTKLSGRTGVVFFKDYWQRKNESFEGRSGDHIDLWRHNRITGASMWYRSVIEFLGFVSDLNKSRNIWFWEVK
jgi:hypothetical protein